MLHQLYIHNYILIDEINIQFSSQLNVITGETGAGKSIIMGALSLILGERADTNVLLNKDKKCIIEGCFKNIQYKAVKQFLQSNEIEGEEDLLLRREISAAGKSRAFINDTPVTLTQLKELASYLVDLHRQFDTLELGNTNFQRDVVDALANNATALLQYQNVYRQLKQETKQLEQLQQRQFEFRKEQDYNQFLFNELEELSLKENELENLDGELKALNNSEAIKTALQNVYHNLKEAEQPILQSIKQMVHQLQPFAELNKDIKTIVERLLSSQIELQDIAAEAENIGDAVLYDEKRIEQINDKLTQGYKLLKKHQVQTTNELLSIQAELEIKLQSVLKIEEEIISKQQLINQLQVKAAQAAEDISSKRKAQIKPLVKQVNSLLTQVGMPNASIKVEISKTSLNEFGEDDIEFLFDANATNRFEAIRKVASGGELSRLMLCIKSLVASKIELATLIFDEIDTGISGEAAKQVGIIMKALTNSMQVICITHQPQIAAKAHTHLFVYKQTDSNLVKTGIKQLSHDERIVSIAKMMSGENPSEAAMLSVKEMMN